MFSTQLCLAMWFACRITAGSDITSNATVSEEFDLPSLDSNFKTSPPEGPDSTTLIGGAITSPLVRPGTYQRWPTADSNLRQSGSRRVFTGRLNGRETQSNSYSKQSGPHSTPKTCQYIFTVQNAADCTHTSTEIAVHHVSKTVLPSTDDLSELSRRLARLEKAVYGASSPSPRQELQRDGVGISQVNVRSNEPTVTKSWTTEPPKSTPSPTLIEMARSLLKQLTTLEQGISKSEKEKEDLRVQNENLIATLRRSVVARRNFYNLKTSLEDSLQKLREENSRLLSANATATRENTILKSRNKRLVSLQETCRKNIRSLESEKARAKARVLQCERQRSTCTRLNDRLQDRVRNMTSAVERCMKMSYEDESLQYELEKEREKQEALTEENLELKEKLANATKRIEELTEAMAREREDTRFNFFPSGRRDDQDFSYCGRITSISRPETVAVAQSYIEKKGVWMMDPLEALGEGKVWSMSTLKDKVKELKQYQSLRKFVSNQPETIIILPVYAESNGAVVYNGSFYYQRRNSRKLVRYDLQLKRILRERAVHHAGFHGTFAYQWGGHTDIDLAVDELGLWVIYSTRQNDGNIVLSKLNPVTMRAISTDKTTIPKRTVANAFMACGILYTVDSYNTANASLNYEYDTFRRRSKRISIPITNQHRYNVMIDYNPHTREIFSWDDSYQVKYYVSLDNSLGKLSQLPEKSTRRRG